MVRGWATLETAGRIPSSSENSAARGDFADCRAYPLHVIREACRQKSSITWDEVASPRLLIQGARVDSGVCIAGAACAVRAENGCPISSARGYRAHLVRPR